MVQLAQLVEPWIVVPVVVGSSPILHPKVKSGNSKALFPFFAFIGIPENFLSLQKFCLIFCSIKQS